MVFVVWRLPEAVPLCDLGWYLWYCADQWNSNDFQWLHSASDPDLRIHGLAVMTDIPHVVLQ